MNGLRRVSHEGLELLVAARDGALHPLDEPLATLLAGGLDRLHEAVDAALAREAVRGDVDLLAPVDRQEVWASGVTYERSRQARVEEAVVKSVYDLVFEAERPEVFMKMPAYRVPLPGAPLRVRADSTWDVPEPELALVLTAQGEVAGYLVADDLSSRSIEGENPLYLAQAKIFDDSLGLSDTIVLARDLGERARSARISLRIERAGSVDVRGRDVHSADAPLVRRPRGIPVPRALPPERRRAADRHRARAAGRVHARGWRHRRDRDRGRRPPPPRCLPLRCHSMRIAVVGAGAMGSVYAGLLADAGNEVWAIDTWQEHVDAIRERGLHVEGASGDRTVRLQATSDPGEVGAVDLVVVATKARDVEAAAERARPLLGPETVVVPIQNGLGSADRVALVLGEERVAIGVAGGFGASIVAPGHVHHNGWQLIRLGERRGKVTPRIERVAEVWRDAGFQVATFDDVDRLVWEKLVCNAAFSGTCALLETTIGEVLADPDAWSVAEACAREAFAVAGASGIELDVRRPVDLRSRVRRQDAGRPALDAARPPGRPALRGRRDQRRDSAGRGSGRPRGARERDGRRARAGEGGPDSGASLARPGRSPTASVWLPVRRRALAPCGGPRGVG